MLTISSSKTLLPGIDDPGVKGFRLGTDRVVAPDETLVKIVPAMGSMGITRIANLTGLDRVGIPVVSVCRPNARSVVLSIGSGVDLSAAKCSALMASVGSYHAERVSLPLEHASYEEMLDRHAVVDVDRLPRRATSPFNPGACILWVEGFDLMAHGGVWVPYEVVHTNLTVPLPAGSGCFDLSTNGLAAGNHMLEAISHGLSEVIERDAATLWEFAGGYELGRTRVDLLTVHDPDCRSVLARFRDAGVEVAAWEITSDVGIAAYRCMAIDQEASPCRPLTSIGTGCHRRPEIALLEALIKAAAHRIAILSGSQETADGWRASGREVATETDQRERFGLRGAPTPFPTRRCEGGLTFEDDIQAQLRSLRRVGIRQAIAVDLSSADRGIPVVRIVVPGLEAGNAAERSSYSLGQRALAAERAREPGS